MLKSMRQRWQRLSIITSSGGWGSSSVSAVVATTSSRRKSTVAGIRYVHVAAALSAGTELGALSLSAYATSSSSSAATAFASRGGGISSDKLPSRGCAPHHSSTAAAAAAMSTAPSFADFLSRLPAQISEGRDGDETDCPRTDVDVRVFMGNEAGDADSIISSLALAYVRSLRPRRQLQIPVVSIPRTDMKLRRDATLLLDLCGVDVDGLLHVDDPPVAERLLRRRDGDGDVSVTLTDHNRIRPSLSHMSSNVAEIVDHHEDGGHHPNVVGAARNVAFDGGHALVGSACTLVAEELLRYDGNPGETAHPGESGAGYDPSVALALLGTILLDTQNMSPETGRGTERDRGAIDGLLGRTPWRPGEVPDRSALYDRLQGAKFERAFWRDMSVRDCLRIDYKRFEFKSSGSGGASEESDSHKAIFGISSVLVPLSELVSKEGFCEGAAAYIDEQDDGDFRLLAVMSLVVDDDDDGGDAAIRREIVLLGDDETVVESMSEYLLCGDGASSLRLSPMEGMNGVCCAAPGPGSNLVVRAFSQGNVKASRKQVAPIMSRHPPMSKGTACL